MSDLGVALRKASGSRFSLQVLAPTRRGCGLSATIAYAKHTNKRH